MQTFSNYFSENFLFSKNKIPLKATSTSQSTSTTDDLGLLSDTLARLDAEIERDIEQGFVKKETAPSNLDLLQGAMQRIAQLEAQVKEANKRAILVKGSTFYLK